MRIKKLLKFFARLITWIILPIVIYLIFAIILSVIPVNSKPAKADDISIFILTNGVHTDLVLPLQSELKDWTQEIKFEHIKSMDKDFKYLAFGWGDKGFYLETPTWSDLKFKTAFNAVFGLGGSAVHVTFFKGMHEDNDCKEISLSSQRYIELVSFIENTFSRDPSGNIMLIDTDAGYGSRDAFYEAKGRYSLFKTCNTWTNNGLKKCEQKACLWTPFDRGIFWHYK